MKATIKFKLIHFDGHQGAISVFAKNQQLQDVGKRLVFDSSQMLMSGFTVKE